MELDFDGEAKKTQKQKNSRCYVQGYQEEL